MDRQQVRHGQIRRNLVREQVVAPRYALTDRIQTAEPLANHPVFFSRGSLTRLGLVRQLKQMLPMLSLVLVQKQAKQVFGLGVACRLIRYPYRRRYRTDQPDIRQAPR
jgi:hypothetical protein